VDRISPEAPVPVLRVRESESRLGGAANVARNVVSLGARCRLVKDVDGLYEADPRVFAGARRFAAESGRLPTIDSNCRLRMAGMRTCPARRFLPARFSGRVETGFGSSTSSGPVRVIRSAGSFISIPIAG